MFIFPFTRLNSQLFIYSPILPPGQHTRIVLYDSSSSSPKNANSEIAIFKKSLHPSERRGINGTNPTHHTTVRTKGHSWVSLPSYRSCLSISNCLCSCFQLNLQIQFCSRSGVLPPIPISFILWDVNIKLASMVTLFFPFRIVQRKTTD